jgi:hypothetical protein
VTTFDDELETILAQQLHIIYGLWLIVNNQNHIHDVTFISNDLRYLSCRRDFSSNQSIKSGRDDIFIPDVCLNIICDENFTFNIMCLLRIALLVYSP